MRAIFAVIVKSSNGQEYVRGLFINPDEAETVAATLQPKWTAVRIEGPLTSFTPEQLVRW